MLQIGYSVVKMKMCVEKRNKIQKYCMYSLSYNVEEKKTK